MARRLAWGRQGSPLHLCPAAGQLLFHILFLMAVEEDFTTENSLRSLKSGGKVEPQI